MILTPHRSICHSTPSATPSTTPFKSSNIYFRPQTAISHQASPSLSPSPSRGVAAPVTSVDLKRTLDQRTSRGMTAVDSQRKRRATSPTYGSRTAGPSAQMAVHKHYQSANGFMSLNWEDLKDSPINLHAILTPPVYLRDDPGMQHTIELSSIEQCMPRAYIRVCLAYRLEHSRIDDAVSRLNQFVRRTVDAKPYLAGYVMPVDGSTRAGPVAIRFTNDDYEQYPPVAVQELLDTDGEVMDYEELNELGLPPSKLLPEEVASLPAMIADENRAPVFRAQANIVKGGLIVSLYLHHCISDGTGLGLLTNGSVQDDNYTFRRYLDGQQGDAFSLAKRLTVHANHMSIARKTLSYSSANQITDRPLSFRRQGEHPLGNPPGRGCVISIPDASIIKLRDELTQLLPGTDLSKHDVLQALIWRHMVRARLPVVRKRPDISTSKLLIPVNVRNRLKPELPKGYFGAAVDFAAAEFDIDAFARGDNTSLAQAASVIKNAVAAVDDDYVRQAIALARSEDPTVDVRDLLAANIDRVSAADLYITSWERLELYDATLDMGLGRPEWIRKPWSRDPGSCIILPRNRSKAQFEVTIQMTEDDMGRLLSDKEFMKHVARVID